MSLRKSVGFIALPAVVVLLGVVVARVVEKEDLTKQLAVFAAVVAFSGFLVNYGKAAYDVWDKERERKKKEGESKERIKVRAIFKHFDVAESVVGVELFNEGSAIVAIRSVSLVVKAETGEVVEELVAFPEKTTKNSSEYDATRKLGPKDHVYFFVCGGGNPELRPSVLASLPAENMWIVIDSFGTGEVARVTGNEIKAAIRKPSLENPDKAERMRIAQSNERVRATPIFQRQSGFNMRAKEVVGVSLYNEGDDLVNILRVEFVVQTGQEKQIRVMGTNPRPRNLNATMTDDATKLDPKHDATFLLKDDGEFTLEGLLRLDPDQLWISIESHTGIVAKVNGRQIQDMLRR